MSLFRFIYCIPFTFIILFFFWARPIKAQSKALFQAAKDPNRPAQHLLAFLPCEARHPTDPMHIGVKPCTALHHRYLERPGQPELKLQLRLSPRPFLARLPGLLHPFAPCFLHDAQAMYVHSTRDDKSCDWCCLNLCKLLWKGEGVTLTRFDFCSYNLCSTTKFGLH